MRNSLSFFATVLIPVSLWAAAEAPLAKTVKTTAASPSIELGTRIGPVEEDIKKKMIKYIRAQGTLSGQVSNGPGYTTHVVAIRCRLPQGELGKGDQPYCEYVEVKEPAPAPEQP